MHAITQPRPATNRRRLCSNLVGLAILIDLRFALRVLPPAEAILHAVVSGCRFGGIRHDAAEAVPPAFGGAEVHGLQVRPRAGRERSDMSAPLRRLYRLASNESQSNWTRILSSCRRRTMLRAREASRNTSPPLLCTSRGDRCSAQLVARQQSLCQPNEFNIPASRSTRRSASASAPASCGVGARESACGPRAKNPLPTAAPGSALLCPSRRPRQRPLPPSGTRGTRPL